MKSVLLAALAGLVVAGCSTTLPVQGQLGDGSDRFTGSATGYLDGAGTLEIVSERGVSCVGEFVYVNERRGEGTFICDDGRSGPFTFVSTGMRGVGSGTLSGRTFTFSFG